MVTEKLTKIDVARRQLDESIRMFFDRRDTVSTHTVASAAAQVLADLGKHRGFQGWSRNKTAVKLGCWKRWRAAITEFERFFKHADEDPNATCEFHPESTPLSIIESVEILRVFTGKFTWEGFIFSLWFSFTYPDALRESDFKKAIMSQSALVKYTFNDFSMVTLLLRRQHAAPAALRENLLV